MKAPCPSVWDYQCRELGVGEWVGAGTPSQKQGEGEWDRRFPGVGREGEKEGREKERQNYGMILRARGARAFP